MYNHEEMGDLPDTEEEAHGSSTTFRSCYGKVHWLLQEAKLQLMRANGEQHIKL